VQSCTFHFFQGEIRMMSHIIFVEILCAVFAAGSIFAVGKLVEPSHCWKADCLKEASGDVCMASIYGVLITMLCLKFGHSGSDAPYRGVGCALVMTFLYPFLAYSWIKDWMAVCGRDGKQRYGLGICLALTCIAASAFVAGVGLAAVNMEAGQWMTSLAHGLLISAVTTAILLLCASMVGRGFARSSIM
jgi:hypothetical protein